MALRLISAAIGVPLVLGAVWAGLPWLSLLAAVAASLGALEFYRLAERRGTRPATLLGIGWTLALIVAGDRGGSFTPWAILAGGSLSFAWHQLRRMPGVPSLFTGLPARSGFAESIEDWTYTAAGALYMGWVLSLALVLRGEADGLEWLLVVLLGTFATDTGAFFIGRTLGRRPLAPSISPGKTWEGAVGGFLFGTAAVTLLTQWLGLPLPIWQGAILGALVGVSAQVGDLVESRLKRASGAKESGWLIPGHGGVLDRLDSVVFVLVVVYYFSIWVAT